MPDAGTLALVAAASLALAVVPGPAVVYIVAQSIDQGRRAGAVSALGVATGGLLHVTAAAIGVSSLVLSSAVAFSIVKYAGAAYLVWVGVRRLLAKDVPIEVEARPRKRHRRLYRDGVVVNVLNPKTALFFLAFLPQFVDLEAGSVALQLVVFGLTFVLIAVASDLVWAFVAGTAAGWFRTKARALRLASGTIFVGLGVAAARSG